MSSEHVNWGMTLTKVASHFPRYTYEELLDLPVILVRMYHSYAVHKEAIEQWHVSCMTTASMLGLGGKMF